MNTDSARGTIVVGVDGSGHSDRALAWAVDEARMRGMTLRVIYAFPELLSLVGSPAHEYYPQMEKEAQQVFERALAAMPDTTGVRVERVLVAGNPSKVLVEASQDADLLVVGSRGVGGFHGMLTGSVSMQCVQHASCPVLVVRPPEEGEPGGPD
jgi:nucleotide-binding universal stress UspA family protein